MEKKKLYIIKIGGNVINDPSLLEDFLSDFSKLDDKKILIHGGGKILDAYAARIGIEQKMVSGRRLTDAATLDLALMVYGGLVNKKIVASLQKMSCNALGVTGADLNLLTATKRPAGSVNYGFVGDVNASSVNVKMINALIETGIVLVFSALTHDGNGQMLNTNADSVTYALASALSELYEVELHYCFEKPGVLVNTGQGEEIIARIHSNELPGLIDKEVVNGGMIPKLETAFGAVSAGVSRVVIGHARDILSNIQIEKSVGTSLIA